MKKIIATVMATAMCLTAGLASACANKNTNYVEEAPMYSTEKELYINSWIGVSEGVPKFGENGKVVWEISEQLPKFERMFTEEEIDAQFKAVKDAGFNYIACGLYCYNADYYKKMLPYAEKYGLKQFLKNYPSSLSGGMRQRAALIRTLAVDPDVLLLDEPFSALDYQTRLSVCDDVYKIIRNENKTALLITHDISEAISVADKIFVLSKRPAKVIAEHAISFPESEPLKRRENKQFSSWFEVLWKELNA